MWDDTLGGTTFDRVGDGGTVSVFIYSLKLGTGIGIGDWCGPVGSGTGKKGEK